MRRNSLHDTESVYTSNRTLIIRVFCDSRPSDESLYRQNGETLSGELNFVILPGMETLQLEPTTPPPSARMTQLSRGLTSFYRVVTTLARCRVSSEAVNWRYAKLTHYLRPALASGSLTVCVVMGCDRRSLAAGRRLGRLAQRATVRRRVNLEAVAAGLRERGRELGEELCVARGMLERVARELEEVRGEREELVKRNEEREREVAGLRGELERMRGRKGMDGLREDMVNRKEEMEDMKEMKDMKDMVNRKEDMEEMKGRLDEKKKEVDGLKRMMEERRKEVDGLRGVVEEKNRELDTMREEMEELERQLAAMRRPAVRDPTDKSDHEDPINTPIPVSSNNASDLAAMNNPINPTSIVNTPSTTNMTNPINQANHINTINPTNTINSINTINTPNTINTVNQTNPTNETNPINSSNTPNTTNTINTHNPINTVNQTNPINSSNTPNPTSPCSQESLETLRERLREQETQTRLAVLRSATLE